MAGFFQIFTMFAKLSVFAFGGGYVMFPMLQIEVERSQLISMTELNDVIALAGMSPGAVAVNAAVGVGYTAAGFWGAVAAFTGIALPCALIVIIAATCFLKIYDHPMVRAALYGLRPVITGIIIYAAIRLAGTEGILFPSGQNTLNNGFYASINGLALFEVRSFLILAASFLILVKTKIHPIYLILASGVVGIILF